MQYLAIRLSLEAQTLLANGYKNAAMKQCARETRETFQLLLHDIAENNTLKKGIIIIFPKKKIKRI